MRKNDFLRNAVRLGHYLVTVSHLKESDPVCNDKYTSQALQRTKLELKRSKTREVMRVWKSVRFSQILVIFSAF